MPTLAQAQAYAEGIQIDLITLLYFTVLFFNYLDLIGGSILLLHLGLDYDILVEKYNKLQVAHNDSQKEKDLLSTCHMYFI